MRAFATGLAHLAEPLPGHHFQRLLERRAQLSRPVRQAAQRQHGSARLANGLHTPVVRGAHLQAGWRRGAPSVNKGADAGSGKTAALHFHSSAQPASWLPRTLTLMHCRRPQCGRLPLLRCRTERACPITQCSPAPPGGKERGPQTRRRSVLRTAPPRLALCGPGRRQQTSAAAGGGEGGGGQPR